MFGEKALELTKELQRSKVGTISAFNEDVMRQVLEEMRALFEQNQRDVTLALAGEQLLFSAIQIRHSALERNKRCLLAYLFNRLEYVKETRWQFGSVLPAEIKQNLSEQELQWFNKYSKCLANYMSSIGGCGGLDLTQDVKPPKTLYIEVRCLTDHGEFETQDGSTILLKKNSQHFLLRSECEHLVRQGFLEHIVH
ncbi:DNA replication complex GINS protein PSF1 [Lamellibrachia satsuma]|nr:DNA replication complex GINS protein PSF1 [Lamellibrachia satsuma]